MIRLLVVLVLTLGLGCGDDDGTGTDAGRDAARADTGSDSGGGECTPECGAGRECCEGACVNTANDPRHCGSCNSPCAGDLYCTGGSCTDVPCDTTCAGGETCCGSMCCGAGQICCDPQGPISIGPECVTPDPETGTCPQGCAPLCACNAPDTPIATPEGWVAVADLKVGDLVYSVDNESVVIVPVAAVRTFDVPSDHRVVQLTLDDGTVARISPSHPLVDGRTIGDLALGDMLGDIGVTGATLVPYALGQTHDILPASSTGAYFVGEALIASTLAP